MPPSPLLDPETINPEERLFGPERIREVNQQRYEMEQLDGIIDINAEEEWGVGIKEVGDDEFWVEGHVPGNPLMPGCLIVEAAAQLSSFYYGHIEADDDQFIGFGGLEDVSFRAPVKPGDQLVLIAQVIEIRSRRMKFQTQGLILPNVIFQGIIIGMPVSG